MNKMTLKISLMNFGVLAAIAPIVAFAPVVSTVNSTIGNVGSYPKQTKHTNIIPYPNNKSYSYMNKNTGFPDLYTYNDNWEQQTYLDTNRTKVDYSSITSSVRVKTGWTDKWNLIPSISMVNVATGTTNSTNNFPQLIDNFYIQNNDSKNDPAVIANVINNSTNNVQSIYFLDKIPTARYSQGAWSRTVNDYLPANYSDKNGFNNFNPDYPFSSDTAFLPKESFKIGSETRTSEKLSATDSMLGFMPSTYYNTQDTAVKGITLTAGSHLKSDRGDYGTIVYGLNTDAYAQDMFNIARAPDGQAIGMTATGYGHPNITPFSCGVSYGGKDMLFNDTATAYTADEKNRTIYAPDIQKFGRQTIPGAGSPGPEQPDYSKTGIISAALDDTVLNEAATSDPSKVENPSVVFLANTPISSKGGNNSYISANLIDSSAMKFSNSFTSAKVWPYNAKFGVIGNVFASSEKGTPDSQGVIHQGKLHVYASSTHGWVKQYIYQNGKLTPVKGQPNDGYRLPFLGNSVSPYQTISQVVRSPNDDGAYAMSINSESNKIYFIPDDGSKPKEISFDFSENDMLGDMGKANFDKVIPYYQNVKKKDGTLIQRDNNEDDTRNKIITGISPNGMSGNDNLFMLQTAATTQYDNQPLDYALAIDKNDSSKVKMLSPLHTPGSNGSLDFSNDLIGNMQFTLPVGDNPKLDTITPEQYVFPKNKNDLANYVDASEIKKGNDQVMDNYNAVRATLSDPKDPKSQIVLSISRWSDIPKRYVLTDVSPNFDKIDTEHATTLPVDFTFKDTSGKIMTFTYFFGGFAWSTKAGIKPQDLALIIGLTMSALVILIIGLTIYYLYRTREKRAIKAQIKRREKRIQLQATDNTFASIDDKRMSKQQKKQHKQDREYNYDKGVSLTKISKLSGNSDLDNLIKGFQDTSKSIKTETIHRNKTSSINSDELLKTSKWSATSSGNISSKGRNSNKSKVRTSSKAGASVKAGAKGKPQTYKEFQKQQKKNKKAKMKKSKKAF